MTHKVTHEMRQITWKGDINGKVRPFRVFAKLERNLSPRDMARLKGHMLTFIRSVYAMDMAEDKVYTYICDKIYGRQYVGPSKFYFIPSPNFLLFKILE